LDERIQTLHPNNEKKGVNIDKVKYEVMNMAIIGTIQGHGEMTFKELLTAVKIILDKEFIGSITWYFTT